jgi:rubredoxin
MEKWRCSICEYVYDPKQGDPETGINPGTSFGDLPDYWGCPDCGASKQNFERYTGDETAY